jgi:hypothetical protein
MWKNYAKCYADSRDEKGKRHRKACRSKKTALRLSARTRAATARKDQPKPQPSRSSRNGTALLVVRRSAISFPPSRQPR